MREAGEPTEFGIFDFYKVFSRAFGEEDNGVGGTWNGSRGMSSKVATAHPTATDMRGIVI